jgi:hypothetical protein
VVGKKRRSGRKPRKPSSSVGAAAKQYTNDKYPNLFKNEVVRFQLDEDYMSKTLQLAKKKKKFKGSCCCCLLVYLNQRIRERNVQKAFTNGLNAFTRNVGIGASAKKCRNRSIGIGTGLSESAEEESYLQKFEWIDSTFKNPSLSPKSPHRIASLEQAVSPILMKVLSREEREPEFPQFVR